MLVKGERIRREVGADRAVKAARSRIEHSMGTGLAVGTRAVASGASRHQSDDAEERIQRGGRARGQALHHAHPGACRRAVMHRTGRIDAMGARALRQAGAEAVRAQASALRPGREATQRRSGRGHDAPVVMENTNLAPRTNTVNEM